MRATIGLYLWIATIGLWHLPDSAAGTRFSQCVIDRLQDFVIAAKPKFERASWKGKNFNVYVVSSPSEKGLLSPSRTLSRTINELTQINDALEHLGFKQRVYVEVLVESNRGAISTVKKDGKNTVFGPAPAQISVSPWMFNYTPNIIGKPRLFWGMNRKHSGDWLTAPRTLVLPIGEDGAQILDQKFTLAHEWAHNTEPFFIKSRMWQEARADFLAFVVSGRSSLEDGPTVTATSWDINGNWTVKTISEIGGPRDISNPRVVSTNDIIPNLDAYHENSTVISNVLFQVAEHFGAERSLQFIKWLDSSKERALPGISDRKEKTNQDTGYIYTDGKQGSSARAAILTTLTLFSDQFRDWAKSEGFSRNELDWIESLLKSKRI